MHRRGGEEQADRPLSLVFSALGSVAFPFNTNFAASAPQLLHDLTPALQLDMEAELTKYSSPHEQLLTRPVQEVSDTELPFAELS